LTGTGLSRGLPEKSGGVKFCGGLRLSACFSRFGVLALLTGPWKLLPWPSGDESYIVRVLDVSCRRRGLIGGKGGAYAGLLPFGRGPPAAWLRSRRLCGPGWFVAASEGSRGLTLIIFPSGYLWSSDGRAGSPPGDLGAGEKGDGMGEIGEGCPPSYPRPLGSCRPPWPLWFGCGDLAGELGWACGASIGERRIGRGLVGSPTGRRSCC